MDNIIIRKFGIDICCNLSYYKNTKFPNYTTREERTKRMRKFNLSPETLVYSATKPIEGITSINLDIVIGEIEVIPYDKPDLCVEYYFAKPQHFSRYRVGVMQNINSIDIELKKGNLFFDLFAFTSICVVVYLPKAYENRLHIVGTTANLVAKGIRVSELKTNMVTGTTDFEYVEADSMSLSCVTGSMNLKEITTNGLFINGQTGTINVQEVHLRHPQAYNTIIDVTNISGKVDMSVRDCYDKIRVNVTTGSVALRVPSDYHFSSSFKSVSGKVKTHTGYSLVAGVNNGRQNEVSVTAVTGSVNIYQ